MPPLTHVYTVTYITDLTALYGEGNINHQILGIFYNSPQAQYCARVHVAKDFSEDKVEDLEAQGLYPYFYGTGEEKESVSYKVPGRDGLRIVDITRCTVEPEVRFKVKEDMEKRVQE